ncbi:leukotriene B4 receptor 1 [Lutzomyia longipalpis]|uniref:leukotriene B4 receptor 1 n=1 Tax=Lutzomyia longipalpis TaxID=7200 RepID=UPI0024837B79|nr:leukotriene B4 receptor 1 [Lutzomyia longipalpis]
MDIIHDANQVGDVTPLWHNDTASHGNRTSGDWLSSSGTLVLLGSYCTVIFVGVFGNASLVVTLCAQGRLRNPLLVALCVADLIVSGVAAPLTVVSMAFNYSTWSLPPAACKAISFIKSMPVAASTFCLFMLSLDRFATVKHPRLAQLRQTRFLPTVLALGAWFTAILISVPVLLAHRVDERAQMSGLSHALTACRPDYGDYHVPFLTTHTLLVFVIPGFGVVLNHLAVRRKLCALSLTARAAHGELPLPMPILRRPTHMIIVTGMAPARGGVVGEQDDSSDAGGAMESNLAGPAGSQKAPTKVTPKTPRAIRREQMRRRQRSKRASDRRHGPELPLPQTSTLRSRRRLANLLVGAALIFVACWTPHVVCIVGTQLGSGMLCTKALADFSLLLGYTHSAVSPIVYWFLNHNTLRQSLSCTPCWQISSAQKFLRTHFRLAAPSPPPSSTNEAALGAFNPRYIKSRPQPMPRPQASSHYLY